jgi:hypothetical protein
MTGSGGTLKVDDKYLEDFANNEIKSFLEALGGDPVVLAVERFALAGGNGIDGAGDFTQLLAGGGPLTQATDLQAKFKLLCQQVQTCLTTLQTQTNQLAVDLKTAADLLHNAEDEALTEAQMMQVLGDVLGKIGGPNPPVQSP